MVHIETPDFTPPEPLSKLSILESTSGKGSNDASTGADPEAIPGICFVNYQDESQLDAVMRLVGKDLSEPYSIFTYRYFLLRFPELCILAVPEEGGDPVGCVVCKIDEGDGDGTTSAPAQPSAPISNYECHENFLDDNGCDNRKRRQELVLSGYMAMLAVDNSWRRSGIGTSLATRAIRRMREKGCISVTLETEVSNAAAIRLYEDRLGFVREELLVRYYINYGHAWRLRLWFDCDRNSPS
jgi:peptide alpha-N-acetyltransferase